ncbi:MAG: SRPBCC family protein [Acidobacteria bacterium]|nr:SRPBCC family protein [Acidobacteriota bacterium]
MPANAYHFITEWRVDAPRELLYEILKEGKDYPGWWPEVYLGASFRPSGRTDRVGDRVEFLTKGRLPYRLRWTACVVRHEHPHTIEITASGDFIGRGIWRLELDGSGTHITFDWQILADKPLLRWLSPLFKPIFEWNHGWAMARGFESLCREAQRRQSTEAVEKFR